MKKYGISDGTATDGTIKWFVFELPSCFVVGKYETRIEAEEALIKLSEESP